MGCTMEQNDNGVFYNFAVNRSKPTAVKPEHQEEVAKWRDLVRGSELKVEEEPEEADTGVSSSAASNVC
jgi:hypothetical protein